MVIKHLLDVGGVKSTPVYATFPVSEITSGTRRLDAEAYMSDGFVARNEIRRSGLRVRTLGELARIWKPFPGRMKAIRVAPEHGVPFLTATQVFDIWPTPRKWIARSKTAGIEDRYVSPGWILVTCSGAVGNTMIAYSAHAGLVVSDDLLRIESHDDALQGYIYAFLRTRAGRAMMTSGQYGSVIKHLDISHLEETPIPFVDHLVEPLAEAVTETFAMRDQAYQLDMKSRSKFSDALADQPQTLSKEDGYVVKASQLFGGRRRLEAYAHSPISRFICQVYELNAETIVALGEVAQVYLPGRFKRIFGEVGTAYLDSEPIFKINPEITKFLTPATDIDLDDYQVQRGSLLMARSRQTYGLNGQAIIANDWHEGKVVTEHIIRIVPIAQEIRSGYLQTILSHPALGQPLVVSRAYGTSVPELAPEDIRQLPIPRLKRETEDEIAESAEQANELRRKADENENLAVARLEGELNRRIFGLTRESGSASLATYGPARL